MNSIGRLTRKQTNLIIENTPEQLIGTQAHIHSVLGAYSKSDANWSYVAGWTADGDLVVTRFGEVVGWRV